MKNKIRPVYSELQGYLLQAQKINRESIYKEEAVVIGKQLSSTINELNELTSLDFNKYKCEAFCEAMNRSSIMTLDLNVYRLKLGGLISRLHGEYFFDETVPFSGVPSTIINQNQTQSVQVQLLLDFQSKLDDKINSLPPDHKDRPFLEKIKSSLSSIKNFSDVINLVITTAKSLGLNIDDILSLFS